MPLNILKKIINVKDFTKTHRAEKIENKAAPMKKILFLP